MGPLLSRWPCCLQRAGVPNVPSFFFTDGAACGSIAVQQFFFRGFLGVAAQQQIHEALAL